MTQLFTQYQVPIPNKKYYDPRKWIREGENTFVNRLVKAFEDLNNVNTL